MHPTRDNLDYALALLVADHQDQLTAELMQAMRASLGHAAWAI